MAETAISVSHTRLREFIAGALLPRYHELWQAGYIRMDAEPTVVRDEVATGLLEPFATPATTAPPPTPR